MLFEDLQEMSDYDETISKLWLGEFIFKYTNWREGISSSISLHDCIDFNFRN